MTLKCKLIKERERAWLTMNGITLHQTLLNAYDGGVDGWTHDGNLIFHYVRKRLFGGWVAFGRK